MLVTRFPGLRSLCLQSKDVQCAVTSEEDILALWDPSGDRVSWDVAGLDTLRFAAACIADGEIAAILETTSHPLWCVTDIVSPFSTIERLLVATDCE